MKITKNDIDIFIEELIQNEYSKNTIEKYKRDIVKLYEMSEERVLGKKDIIEFKSILYKKYKPRSVNSILAAWNHFFEFNKRFDLKVKQLKIQQEAFLPEERVLTKAEYKRLVHTAGKIGKVRIGLIMQTICCTGIRVSELKYITVEAVKVSKAYIQMKGKNRTILIPKHLRQLLIKYIKNQHIKSGEIFLNSKKKPISRSDIWKEMKKVAKVAKVLLGKVFPHNLRHLFAREFYQIKKDIVQLADILGHSNINTTRIYMISTGKEHQKLLNNMDLLVYNL